MLSFLYNFFPENSSFLDKTFQLYVQQTISRPRRDRKGAGSPLEAS